MIIGIFVFRYENKINDSKEVIPEFEEVSKETSSLSQELQDQIITADNLYWILVNHTTSAISNKPNEPNVFFGRLKKLPFKIISYLKEKDKQIKYLTIWIFNLDDDLELYEPSINQLIEKLDRLYGRLYEIQRRDKTEIVKIIDEINNLLKFNMFQIDRFDRLTKIQKVALLYATPERLKTHELLRKGPLEKEFLRKELEKISPYPNLDLILAPFIELNIVRSDWAKGNRDKLTGKITGQGEYLYLVKDIFLIRKPPLLIFEKMKKDKNIGQKYRELVHNYYKEYYPFSDVIKESINLAKIILDPDLFDFISLLRKNFFPLTKTPKITSDFTDPEEILNKLIYNEIVTIIEDKSEVKFLILLTEITPLVIFPEYVSREIAKRSPSKWKEKKNIVDDNGITTEVALKNLRFLETTYNEQVEFQDLEFLTENNQEEA